MPQQNRNDSKVQQIRRAAQTLFLRHGFAGVSTTALAQQAGVSKETLYSRYPNKEAVLADVLEHLIISGEAATSAQQPKPATHADLRRALRSLAAQLSTELLQRDYIELARIVIAETPRLPRVGEIFRQSVAERAFGLTVELLAAGRDAALVRDVDPMAAARMFVGPLVLHALTTVLLVAPSAAKAPPEPLDVDTHVELFLAAVATAPTGK